MWSLLVIFSFVVTVHAHATCVAWPSNCVNADSGCCNECATAIENDQKAIEAGGKNPDGTNKVDWGNAQLNNCIFCAGQCFANHENKIHCQVYDGLKRNEEVEIRELFKRNALGMCSAAQGQFLKVNLPGVGWVAGALTTGKTQATILKTTTTHKDAVTISYMDETLAPEETTVDPNALTTATVDGGQKTPLPTAPPGTLGTGASAKTTAKATVAQACGKSSSGALLYPDKCGVCGGPSKTVCSPASTLAVSQLLVLAIAFCLAFFAM